MLEKLRESIGEAFTEDLQTELESKINEAIDAKVSIKVDSLVEEKTEELDDACEKFKEELTEKACEFMDNRVSELNSLVEQYVDSVVESFVDQHEEIFEVNEADLKNQAILGMLANACLTAGVTANQIDEAENIKIQASSLDNTQRNMLKALKESNDSLKALREENEKLIKMGLISELKEGLTITEAEKFERCASNIEFSRDESYLNRLEALKEEIVDTVITEAEKPADIVKNLNEAVVSKKVKPTFGVASDFASRMNKFI